MHLGVGGSGAAKERFSARALDELGRRRLSGHPPFMLGKKSWMLGRQGYRRCQVWGFSLNRCTILITSWKVIWESNHCVHHHFHVSYLRENFRDAFGVANYCILTFMSVNGDALYRGPESGKKKAVRCLW